MTHSLVVQQREIREQLEQAEGAEQYIPAKKELASLRKSITIRLFYPIEQKLREFLQNVWSRVPQHIRSFLSHKARLVLRMLREIKQKILTIH